VASHVFSPLAVAARFHPTLNRKRRRLENVIEETLVTRGYNYTGCFLVGKT
jgi:hypothetical protein